MFSLLHLLTFLAVALISNPVEDVSFSKDILPIFRQHCFNCHGDGITEGELSLDSITGILQGGHTSSPLLSKDLSDSELYLRITSTSEGYKMPKDGPALSQAEIEKIGKWINHVAIPNASAKKPATSAPATAKTNGYADASSKPLASTPSANAYSDTSSKPLASAPPRNNYADTSSKPLVSTPTSSDSSSSPQRPATAFELGSFIESMEPDQVATFLIGAAFLIVLLGWMLSKILGGRRRGRRHISSNSGRVTSFLSMVLGSLSMLMLLGMGYLHWRNLKLFNENESLRAQLQEHNPYKSAPLIIIDESNLPLPPHPLHPPRLGGKYYRGNDERNEALFNRGFYRTATIDLHLVTPDGTRLQWNDEASDETEIEIVVQRAPGATRELFTQRVRERAEIQHYCETDQGSNQNLKFEAVEEEQQWKARIPLPARDKWVDDKAQGMVYLMFGNQPGEGQRPRPHFGVRYDLTLQDGKISEESELWMGSLYTLGNRVLVPDEKKILLDRWFDWRPIPVIEGEASSDPALLGVEEHQ